MKRSFLPVSPTVSSVSRFLRFVLGPAGKLEEIGKRLLPRDRPGKKPDKATNRPARDGTTLLTSVDPAFRLVRFGTPPSEPSKRSLVLLARSVELPGKLPGHPLGNQRLRNGAVTGSDCPVWAILAGSRPESNASGSILNRPPWFGAVVPFLFSQPEASHV